MAADLPRVARRRAANVLHDLSIYARLSILTLRSHLEYELDFWIGMIGFALTHVTTLLFVWAVFTRVPQLAGWSHWEVVFLHALVTTPHGLVVLFLNGQWTLRGLVHAGRFDQLLVRPFPLVLQVLSQQSSINGAGVVLLGVILLHRSSAEIALTWDALKLLVLLLAILNAAVIFAALTYAANCIAFWEPGADATFPNMVRDGMEFAKFPISLYGPIVQFLLTFLVPFAFVSYLPGLLLLGRTTVPLYTGLLIPLSGLATTLFTYFIWQIGLRRYQGTAT
jgi:ABC-2 type transport system permease protein